MSVRGLQTDTRQPEPDRIGRESVPTPSLSFPPQKKKKDRILSQAALCVGNTVVGEDRWEGGWEGSTAPYFHGGGARSDDQGLRLDSGSWFLGPRRPHCPCPALGRRHLGHCWWRVSPTWVREEVGAPPSTGGGALSQTQLPDTLRWRFEDLGRQVSLQSQQGPPRGDVRAPSSLWKVRLLGKVRGHLGSSPGSAPRRTCP